MDFQKKLVVSFFRVYYQKKNLCIKKSKMGVFGRKVTWKPSFSKNECIEKKFNSKHEKNLLLIFFENRFSKNFEVQKKVKKGQKMAKNRTHFFCENRFLEKISSKFFSCLLLKKFSMHKKK